LIVKDKTNIFSPGNLRASEDNETYKKIVMKWLDSGFTLRYSGGLAPDAAQIMLKGHGIFSNIASNKHQAKLRVLYEVGPIAFLIEKAGGKTITDKRVSLM
jgi:sedoheptulose-bisphosphatase